VSFRPRFRGEHIEAIEAFITHHLEESGKKGLVVGMSGGLDSSLVARLCADAVGPARVLGLMLNDEITEPRDIRNVRSWAKTLRMPLREIDIGPMVESFRKSLGMKPAQRTALGNIKARCRMIVLYNTAALEDRLVIGTGNKSEILIGYFSKWGDGGADFMPLGDLYKTQVRDMARFLRLPKRIIDKVPAAGLWKGQTDEGELGISYDELDRILLGLELQLDVKDIARKTGLSPRKISKVERLVAKNVHKRKMPLIPKLSVRTVGLDWRE
jgi:NAD+ synthase